MEDHEKFYDEVIAPKLMEIGKICTEKGIPFLAVAEYAPGEVGETRMIAPDECLKMVMIRHCTKTAPNIDGYCIGLLRYANEKGIDTGASIVMSMLKNKQPPA